MNWTEAKSGLQSETIGRAATATDEQGKLGWIYSGSVGKSEFYNGTELIGQNESRPSNALYRYNLTSMNPEKVVTQNTIDKAEQGEMVYIPHAGEKGVLVLVGGGDGSGGMVSLFDCCLLFSRTLKLTLHPHRGPWSVSMSLTSLPTAGMNKTPRRIRGSFHSNDKSSAPSLPAQKTVPATISTSTEAGM